MFPYETYLHVRRKTDIFFRTLKTKTQLLSQFKTIETSTVFKY